MVRVRKATQDDTEKKKQLTDMLRRKCETRMKEGVRFNITYLEKMLVGLTVYRTERYIQRGKNLYSTHS